MNNQTVAAVFTLIGLFVLIAGEVHASVSTHPARPAVSHVAHVSRTASMPATTASWTATANSYRSVER